MQHSTRRLDETKEVAARLKGTLYIPDCPYERGILYPTQSGRMKWFPIFKFQTDLEGNWNFEVPNRFMSLVHEAFRKEWGDSSGVQMISVDYNWVFGSTKGRWDAVMISFSLLGLSARVFEAGKTGQGFRVRISPRNASHISLDCAWIDENTGSPGFALALAQGKSIYEIDTTP